ncbi:MAG: signal recognition particle-docking protein FtsY [Planctomycetes bacterium]|nr:signal recognition particle-docking protein FtsY [Planctomycetota bacterium]
MVFARLRTGLSRTRNKIRQAMRTLGGDQSTAEILETLEEILYTADVGPLTAELLDAAEIELKSGRLADPGDIETWLREQLLSALQGPDHKNPLPLVESGPTVVLVVGVNGAGKTTSIAKLVHWLQQRNRKVLVAAGDTFRAAAVEQLTIWCDRLGADLIKSQQGTDPAAVAHDGAEAALARNADVLIVDTAGRLHTQKNLMSELEKISRVIGRKIEGAPHHTLLVLDATTGQNAVQQAKLFGERVPLSGVTLSKLDGTAKGGAAVSIGRQLGLPVCYVGLGEQIEDFDVFNPDEFLEALFALSD